MLTSYEKEGWLVFTVILKRGRQSGYVEARVDGEKGIKVQGKTEVTYRLLTGSRELCRESF